MSKKELISYLPNYLKGNPKPEQISKVLKRHKNFFERLKFASVMIMILYSISVILFPLTDSTNTISLIWFKIDYLFMILVTFSMFSLFDKKSRKYTLSEKEILEILADAK